MFKGFAEYMNFNELYLNILKEDKNYFGFQINEYTFEPFEYKKVFCAASSLNKDLNHVLSRLLNRTDNTLDDIFIVLKRGLDKFLTLSKTKYKERRTKSFHIISKEYKDFKLVIQIVRNGQKDIVKYVENPSEFFYGCDYVCFLYTILKPKMTKKPTDDELFVEEINNDLNGQDILYVD